MFTTSHRHLPRAAIAATVLTVFLSACATTSAPNIEPYAGKDNVGAVNDSMFVGKWNVRQLNAPEGIPQSDSQATISQDGSIVVISDNSSSGVNLKLQMTGTWQASGNKLKTQMESIKEISGNPMGGLLVKMMSSMTSDMSGEAEVYEATKSRFVVVGKEGVAVEYTR